MGSENVKVSEFIVQTLATIVICFMACQTGFVCAWPSYTSALFRSADTVLSAPMTSLHVSLLGSLTNVGGLLVCPFCSYAFNNFGRKYATVLFCVPYVIAWALIAMTTNITVVLIAVTLAGVGIAGQNVSMIYISEIAHDSIRGALTSCAASGYFLGLMISHILGGYLSYIQVVYTHLALAVLSMALLLLLKESPVYLVLRGREKEAAKSVAFYRRMDVKSKEVEYEIAKIKLQVDPTLETMLEDGANLDASSELLKKETTEQQPNSESSWKLLMKSKSSKRALYMVLIIMSLTIMMGCIVLQVYAEPLFIEAVPALPPNMCAILVALDFLIASIICVFLIDRFGRKPLLIVTSVGSGVCTLLLGAQLQFHWAPHWVTALLIYVYSFVYTTGCATIPFVLTAEVFLPEVRSFCNSICFGFVWIFNFITLVIFNPLVETIGLGYVFYMFSIICFIGAVYSHFCVPETKGLSVTDIQKLNRIERTASKRWRGSLRRVIAAAVYNLSCFTHGCSTGWVSGVLGPEALTGGAWLAALPCLVALPAAPFFAVLADVRGRKAGAFCISISFIISCSLAAWCGPRGIWAARVAAGAGGAGALALAPLYCAEIAPRTRGLAAMPALACSGILFAFSAGGVLSAHALSLSIAAPPAALALALLWLPETPAYLISAGRIQDAAKIMCWFEGSDFREDLTDVIEQQEVRIRTSSYGRRPMTRQDSDTFQPMLKRTSGMDSHSDKKTESACRELFRHRRSRRALLTCTVVMSTAAGSGAGAVNSFATAMLRHSTHDLPRLNLTAYNFTVYNGTVGRSLFDTSEAGSILCGIALVLGAAVATVTVDKLGRKMLLLCSCTGITCCLAVLGAYCDPNLHLHFWHHRLWPYREQSYTEKSLDSNISEYLVNTSITEVLKENVTSLKENDGTVIGPTVLLSMVLFLYNIGLGSVPYVMISELFAINVRGLASSLLISWMWLSNFLLLRYYGSIALALGLHGAYYISASITFLGAWYIFLTVPETKGRSQQQIDEILDGPWIVGKKKNR